MAPTTRHEDEQSVSELDRIIHRTNSRSKPRTWTKKRGGALTARQLDALNVIRRHVRMRGIPPSRPELCAELGIG